MNIMEAVDAMENGKKVIRESRGNRYDYNYIRTGQTSILGPHLTKDDIRADDWEVLEQ